jgi:hypothetical protein
MKEEWLFQGAAVPVDVETTAALVTEIKRLIDVVGGMALAQQEQGEPVAWMNKHGDCISAVFKKVQETAGEYATPLYTATPLPVQPVQEPFEYWNAVEGWVKIEEVREHFDSVGCGTIYKTAGEGREPLYTALPQRPWVGLTTEEYQQILIQHDGAGLIAFYNLIESTLRSKNT